MRNKNTSYDAKATALTLGPEPEGNNRFSLTPPEGPTYTLTIADCVRTITPGEFASNGGSVPTSVTANTRLAADLGEDTPSNNPYLKVTSIKLPDSLVTIGDQAFHSHLKVSGELIIPAKVKSIGFLAFRYLGQAEQFRAGVSLKFAPGSQLETIGPRVFNNSGISSIDPLPRSLKTIGSGAFVNALTSAVGSSLSNFVIPGSVTEVGNNAFGSPGNFSGTLTIESPHLTRTPPLGSGSRTGRLGNGIFVEPFDTASNTFSKIIMPREVFISYNAADLNAVFGTGTSYEDPEGNTMTPAP